MNASFDCVTDTDTRGINQYLLKLNIQFHETEIAL